MLPKITFGLDIVGGNQLTIAVDVKDVVQDFYHNTQNTLLSICGDFNADCSVVDNNSFSFVVNVARRVSVLNNQQPGNVSVKEFKKHFLRSLRGALVLHDVSVVNKDNNAFVLRLTLSNDMLNKMLADITDKAIAVLKSRVDGVGVKEVSVQRYGKDKIVILVPQGVDINRIKQVVKTTAKLSFHLMDKTHVFVQKPNQIMRGHVILNSYHGGHNVIPHGDLFYMVEKNVAMGGEYISEVHPGSDGINNVINFRLNSAGTKKFADITKNNIGRLLAIALDDQVLMAPMINVPIVGGSGSITGHFTYQEAQDLSVLLRSGSLPAKISIVNERFIGSIFDKNVLTSACVATIIGLIGVAVLMVLRYRVLGGICVLVLMLNILFTVTIIAVCGFTITLPGMAGLVLMVGMASDANILIYEKMRELKQRRVNDVTTLIKHGFQQAFGTILDANLTTVIAGIALFGFGSSFIKGFSITLICGVVCSVFVATKITKMLVEWIYVQKKMANI